MKDRRILILFGVMAALLIFIGFVQSWNVSLAIINLCLISAIMTLGVNIQWGYAGIVNFGIMGFAALGGLAGVLVSTPPVIAGWQAGGIGLLMGGAVIILTILACIFVWRKTARIKKWRVWLIAFIVIGGYLLTRMIAGPAIEAIESIESARAGNIGGLGLPIMLSWVVGGVFAAGAAFVIGKVSSGLRSDYLAIATLGISEIVVYIIKNEDWLARGVKNVNGLPRPVPYEIELKSQNWVMDLAAQFSVSVPELSSIIVKLCYAALFVGVLAILFWLFETALKSPWGRMLRAIRDNEVAANAMGKNIKAKHLLVFILGSAVVGIAGAMLTTLDGQFTPSSYLPLRFTFLIWVMVIVGGSGNNFGSILGGFIIWFFWIESEPLGIWLIDLITSPLADTSALKLHLLANSGHMRLMTMGLIMLLMLRFSPQGLIPEKKR